MNITFHGAAQNVTGSKHLIHLSNGQKILLDCGLYQGMGKETNALNRTLGFDASTVNYLILSHAHIDHSGLIPLLIANGFRGTIFSTAATRDLCKILLLDSVKIQRSDLQYKNKKLARRNLPLEEMLYDEEDVYQALASFHVLSYGEKYAVSPEIRLELTDAGHIIGSAAVHLTIQEGEKTSRISFSGDIGRYNDLLLRAPQTFDQTDYLLLESTYGNRLHLGTGSSANDLLEMIRHTCLKKRGKLIIPAFSVGRTQELLFVLNKLDLQRLLPEGLPVYVDSPLSAKATCIVANYSEGYNEEVLEVLQVDEQPFHFEGLTFIESVEESMALNSDPRPCVIISASGMAEAGRVKHHIKNNLSNPANTILMVGYCEPNSLGGRLIRGQQEVSIFGDWFKVKAEVRQLQSMSAHGDRNDLLRFVSSQDPKRLKGIFLVHGEYDVQQDLRKTLMEKGYPHVFIPARHETFVLD